MRPKLRFPEFTNEWQNKKLDDIATVNPKVGKLPENFIYIDLDSVKGGVLLKENRIIKIEAPSRAQRLLKKDDVIYQTVRPYQKNNFYFGLNGDYVASTGYAQIRSKDICRPRFVYYLMHTDAFVYRVLVRSTGTNYPAINSSDLAKIPVVIPSIEEQDKIATFLAVIDGRIEIADRQVALLKLYKKGVMQKIFTQQIRFKDVNGQHYPEWHTRELGEIFSEVTKKVGSRRVETYSITAGKGFVTQSQKFGRDISGLQNERYTLLSIGEFAYNKGNSKTYTYGCVYENKEGKSIAIPNVFISFKLEDGNMTSEFFGQLFVSHYLDRHLRKIISSGARMDGLLNVSKQDFFTIKVPLPSGKEQQKIAGFLSAVDDKITAEEAKLIAAKQFKKSLLQRMFV